MPTIGAFAVVFDSDRRVLLCHRRDRDVWNLPGGGVEKGELPTTAAIRETREEAGIEVELAGLVGVYLKPEKDDLVFVFRARPVAGQPSATTESSECRWFTAEELPEKLFRTHRSRIRDALAAIGEPVFRTESV